MSIFSVNFWASALASAFITLLCIWMIKKVAAVANVGVLNEIAQSV